MISDNNLLLRALTLNAMFSGFSAVLMFIAGAWLAEQFGLSSVIPVYVVAGFLAVFAVQLGNIVRTKNIRSWEIKSIISGDIAWVVASVAIITLYYQVITPTAVILLDIAAVAVFFFAVMQVRGLAQYRKLERQY